MSPVDFNFDEMGQILQVPDWYEDESDSKPKPAGGDMVDGQGNSVPPSVKSIIDKLQAVADHQMDKLAMITEFNQIFVLFCQAVLTVSKLENNNIYVKWVLAGKDDGTRQDKFKALFNKAGITNRSLSKHPHFKEALSNFGQNLDLFRNDFDEWILVNAKNVESNDFNGE